MENDIWIQPTHPAFVALEGENFEAASYIIGCIMIPALKFSNKRCSLPL